MKPKEVYKFRVGTQPLQPSLIQGIVQTFVPVVGSQADKSRVSHVCFLIGTDLFDYGPNGFQRRNVGRDPAFDWDKLGNKVNGTTWKTPNELQKHIENSGNWKPILTGSGGYHLFDHNCHHFVKFCLEFVGAGFFYKGYDHFLLDVF